MKNKIFGKITLGGVVAAVFLLAACSDGILPEAPPPPPPPLPEIIAVATNPSIIAGQPSQSVNLNTAVEDGKKDGSIEIISGGTVEISWEIKGIASGELTSAPESILGEPVVLEVKDNASVGKKTVSGITTNVTFTITARNGKSEQTVKIIVVVKPLPTALVINKFEADKTYINAGETVKLCWDVTPADAVVTIKDGSGKTIFPLPVVIDEVSEEVENGLPSNCVDVNPTEDTAYTLTAKTADEQEETSRVEITIAKVALKILSFTADPSVLKEAGDVKLSWEVTPAETDVTIDNGVGKVDAKGSKTIKVEQSTVFTLSASLGSETAVSQASVTLQEGANGGGGNVGIGTSIKLSANTTDVFAGEEVTFSWDAVEISSEDELLLVGPEGTTKAKVKDGSVTVKPTISGTYAAEISNGNSVVRSNQINIIVNNWELKNTNTNWKTIEMIGEVGLVGGEETLTDKDKTLNPVSLGRLIGDSQFETVAYDYAADFGGAYFATYNTQKLKNYGTFSVNGFAKDASSNRVFAAVSGEVIYSDDLGASWHVVNIFPFINSGEREFSSCKGRTQVNSGSKSNTIVNIEQVCDILAVSSGNTTRLLAATDHGVYYADDINNYIDTRGKGTPSPWKGGDFKEPNQLNGTVANELVALGKTIYAATNDGVWFSENSGESWNKYSGGSLSGAVYSITIGDKMLYAGDTTGSLHGRKLDGSDDWQAVNTFDSKVNSIVIVSGSTFVGTDTSIYISRDGKTWLDIGGGKVGGVADISAGKIDGKYSLAIATKNGVFVSKFAASSSNNTEQTEELSVPNGGAVNIMKQVL